MNKHFFYCHNMRTEMRSRDRDADFIHPALSLIVTIFAFRCVLLYTIRTCALCLCHCTVPCEESDAPFVEKNSHRLIRFTIRKFVTLLSIFVLLPAAVLCWAYSDLYHPIEKACSSSI